MSKNTRGLMVLISAFVSAIVLVIASVSHIGLIFFEKVVRPFGKVVWSSSITLGVVSTVLGGIILYLLYQRIDEWRHHRDPRWVKHTTGIWYSDAKSGTGDPRDYLPQEILWKMSNGIPLSPDEQQEAHTPKRITVRITLDIPISRVPEQIRVLGEDIIVGYEDLTGVLPKFDWWECIDINEAYKSPSGYVRCNIVLVARVNTRIWEEYERQKANSQ